MTTQLRRYDVSNEAELDRLAAWFPGLIPVRERYGFTVHGAYVDYENLQFVWIVSHEGDFEAAMAEYNPSPERAAVFEGFDNPITGMHLSFVETIV